VTAFLSWAADPRLEDRKWIGLMVMGYLLITAILMFFAYKRTWKNAH
jgi:cytochrome c1